MSAHEIQFQSNESPSAASQQRGFCSANGTQAPNRYTGTSLYSKKHQPDWIPPDWVPGASGRRMLRKGFLAMKRIRRPRNVRSGGPLVKPHPMDYAAIRVWHVSRGAGAADWRLLQRRAAREGAPIDALYLDGRENWVTARDFPPHHAIHQMLALDCERRRHGFGEQPETAAPQKKARPNRP